MASSQAEFIAWAAGQSPGQILAAAPALNFSGLGPVVAEGVIAADAIVMKSGPQAQANAAAASGKSSNIVNVTAAGMAAVGAGWLALALKLDEAFTESAEGQAFAKWWLSGSTSSDAVELALTGVIPINFGSGPSCKPASQAQGAPPLTSPSQLYDFPLAPNSLASLIVPVLCQGFYQLEQCIPIDKPSDMSWIAPASNLVIASLAALWNSQVSGEMIDYFVPFVPSGGEVGVGWGGWNGWGAMANNTTPWQAKPPFIVPGQEQYAFQPLGAVPTSVADPSIEWGQPGYTYAQWPGAGWSRLSAKSGIWVGPNPALETLAWIGGAAAALALGIGIYALARKKNYFAVARSIPSSIEKAL